MTGTMLATLSVFACSSRNVMPPLERRVAPILISLERRPCYGTCPVYTVRVDDTGLVAYEGMKFVARLGTVTDTASRDSVRVLAAALANAGFFDLADRYLFGEPTCLRYAADAPIVITTITTGGRTKRVEHDHGCSGVPPQLTELENRIDDAIVTRRWTRGQALH